MASANNLLGVVNQLQSMENTLTAILIETALKLSSLTDAKVFVLVDSAEGRRFAGASQLCHAYATNNLTPTVDDIEIVLEPNVKTIRERPLFPPGVQGSKYRAHGSSSSASHQHSDGYHALTSAPHSEEDGGDDDDDDEDEGDGSGANRSAHRSSSYHHGSSRKRGSSGNMQGSLKLPRMGEYGNDSTDGANEEELEPFGTFDEHEGRFKNHAPSTNSYNYGGEYDQDYEPVNVSFVDEFLHDNQKADRVREILDNSAADKASVNHKLTMSLLYDFAKCLFTNCPFQDYKTPSFRNYFESSFNKFWDSFPNFVIWEENDVKFQVGIDKKTDLALLKPPKSFIRKYVRNGVSDLKIKKSGRRRTTNRAIMPKQQQQQQQQQPPPVQQQVQETQTDQQLLQPEPQHDHQHDQQHDHHQHHHHPPPPPPPPPHPHHQHPVGFPAIAGSPCNYSINYSNH